MIDLYYWPTPNGHKITMMLEECGLDYRLIPVNIGNGDQFKPDFLKIAPNNKMPAIVDHDTADGQPISIFESGAILMYLAEKTRTLLPQQTAAKYDVLQWLFWQVGGLGPMLGQNHHFNQYAPERVPYAMERYTSETTRLYGVLDRALAEREFIAGDYSIADIASYPWIVLYKNQQQDLANFPHVARWLKTIAERPATQRAYAAADNIG